jgi:hypothetical protein
MFSHVLVPLDFRFVPRITLMTAAVLASDQGAQLTLLYVSDIATDFPAAPVTAITDEVVKRQYERRGLARAMRGSVTEEVLREADVPVLAIHESPTMMFMPISSEPWVC